MMMWLNTEYAGSSYAYLTPFNRKSASLVLIVSNAKREEMGYYWKNSGKSKVLITGSLPSGIWNMFPVMFTRIR